MPYQVSYIRQKYLLCSIALFVKQWNFEHPGLENTCEEFGSFIWFHGLLPSPINTHSKSNFVYR